MVMLDHLNVDKYSLSDNDLLNIIGGINLTGSLIKSASTALNTLLDVGRSLGTAIRMFMGKKLCGLK